MPVPTLTPDPDPDPPPEPPPPPVVEAADAGEGVTGEFGGPFHTNAVSGNLITPLGLAWSQSVSASRVLAVPGTVVATGFGGVHAFDAATGARRWADVLRADGGAALVGDAVVAATEQGIKAYALSDGAHRWTAAGTQTSDPPVPAGDMVLVRGTMSNLVALDVATGATRWSVDAYNAGRSAVVGDRVYLPFCGGALTVLDRRDGRILGQRSGSGCSGGSLGTAAVGRTVRVGDQVMVDMETLAASPVVNWRAARPGLALQHGGDRTLNGVDPISGQRLWSSRLAIEFGRTYLAGDAAVVVSPEGIAVHDAKSGAERWAARFSPALGEHADALQPAVALGTVFVLRDGRLHAFRAGAPGLPARLQGTIAPLRVIPYGGRFSVEARLVQDVMAVARDVIVHQKTPLRRRPASRTLGRTSLRDDEVSARLKPSLTTDYALTVTGASNEKRFTAVVVPRERSRIRRSGADRNSITAAITLQVPPSISLRGRRYGLYVARSRARRYTRVAVGRIRRTGRGRGRVTLRFRAFDVRGKDFVRSCVTGVSRRGIGFHDRLDRRCGAAGLRF
jgi:hypothetical protein